jgi:hypothetical protein
MTNKSGLWRVTMGLALALTSGCGTLSIEEFREQVQEARDCTEGDTCVLAGAGRCTCGSPVNASRAADLNDAAHYVDCWYSNLDCAPYANMRCVDGKCIGTML